VGCGFRVSGFGFRVSGFGFRVSGFGFRVSGFGFRVRGFAWPLAWSMLLSPSVWNRLLRRASIAHECASHLFVAEEFHTSPPRQTESIPFKRVCTAMGDVGPSESIAHECRNCYHARALERVTPLPNPENGGFQKSRPWGIDFWRPLLRL